MDAIEHGLLVKISEDVDEIKAHIRDMQDFLMTRENERQSSFPPIQPEGRTENIVLRTLWKPTKNPNIECAFSKDATAEDVADARAKKRGMWALFNEQFQNWTIFRKAGVEKR